MTIARDPRTGAVLGQVLDRAAGEPMEGHDYGARRLVLMLTRDGRYVTVPAHSVRLEELR